MRKGTAFTVKLEGSSTTHLMTCCAVVEQSGTTSLSNLTCKRFGQSLQERKHPINPDSEESLKTEDFRFIPYDSSLNLKLISADKVRRDGKMRTRKPACQSFTFFGNSFTTMNWKFKNEEGIYALTKVDPEVELVASSCRGSPVVSIDDLGTVVGVVACSSNGDLELLFFEAKLLREIEEQLKARCSDENGFDVPDSPMIPRDPTPSAPPFVPQNTHPGDPGTNASTSNASLVQAFSHASIQETTPHESQALSQEGKPEESRCIWDRLVQTVTSFQDLLTKLKIHLDPKRDLGGDYRSLASTFGKDMSEIWFLGSRPSPVEELIQDCCPTVRQLYIKLGSDKVRRRDVSKIVEDWVKKERCNCEKCGSLC